jgi:hypothetical protein
VKKDEVESNTKGKDGEDRKADRRAEDYGRNAMF